MSEGLFLALQCCKWNEQGSSGYLLKGNCFLDNLVDCILEGNGLEGSQELPALTCGAGFARQSSESAFVPFRAGLGGESVFSTRFSLGNCICNVLFSLLHSPVLFSLSSYFFAWKALIEWFTDKSWTFQVTLGYKSDLWVLCFAVLHSNLIMSSPHVSQEVNMHHLCSEASYLWRKSNQYFKT